MRVGGECSRGLLVPLCVSIVCVSDVTAAIGGRERESVCERGMWRDLFYVY